MADSGIIRDARRPAGWSPPGPRPRGDDGSALLRPQPGEDLCFLTGDWRIFQRTRGHRWSLDDLVTAWTATRYAVAPRRCLDLGCGIGSVLLMTAWAQPEARCVGIEAQTVSAGLARRSIRWNGVEERVRVIDGDLRDPLLLPEGERFDLVTGTPPYFLEGEGTVSAQVQKGPCRFEQRGGVEAYSEAAARWVADEGTFVICASVLQRERAVAFAPDVGLGQVEELVVIPKEGKEPLVLVFTLRRGWSAPSERRTLTVRDRTGQWTPEFSAVRERMGMPPTPPKRS